MKILVITGSPRRGGNSDLMADEFIRGAKENGHSVEKFATAFKKMSGCMACEKCWSKDKPCVIEDDWQELAAKMEAAEALVFAYPLYWSTMPSQLKRAVDRLFSYCSKKCLRPLTGKSYITLLCGECKGDEIFREVRSVHKGMAGYFSWEQLGEIAIDGVFERGAIQKTDALKKAYELGKSL